MPGNKLKDYIKKYESTDCKMPGCQSKYIQRFIQNVAYLFVFSSSTILVWGLQKPPSPPPSFHQIRLLINESKLLFEILFTNKYCTENSQKKSSFPPHRNKIMTNLRLIIPVK